MYKNIPIVVGITILFLGVGIQPAIAEEQTQEYALMTPSIFGIKKQQISLTSEQSDKLDGIFDDLHTQLQAVESVEETKLLYKRTIDTFVDNDLLSRYDVYLTKKLLFSDIADRFYSTFDKRLSIDTDIENRNCWISGETKYSDFIRPIMYFRDRRYCYFKDFIFLYSPIVFFADISFGYKHEKHVETKDYWSLGWVSTTNYRGTNNIGTKNNEEYFRGGISPLRAQTMTDYYYFYYGVHFFLGIGFNDLNDKGKDYFMGRAALVDIYEKPSV